MKSLNKLNLERIWLQQKDFSKRWRLKIYLEDSKKEIAPKNRKVST